MALRRGVQWCVLWDRRGAELVNMALLFTFGLWLWPSSWSVFDTCPQVYYIMAHAFHFFGGNPSSAEKAWAMIFIVMAVVKAAVLWKDWASWRKWTALVCGGLWTFVAVTVGAAEWQAPAFPIYCLFAANMYRVFFCIPVRQVAQLTETQNA